MQRYVSARSLQALPQRFAPNLISLGPKCGPQRDRFRLVSATAFFVQAASEQAGSTPLDMIHHPPFGSSQHDAALRPRGPKNILQWGTRALTRNSLFRCGRRCSLELPAPFLATESLAYLGRHKLVPDRRALNTRPRADIYPAEFPPLLDRRANLPSIPRCSR